MTVALKTIEDRIVTLLRDNLTDPINRIGIGSYVDHGKGHYKEKTPKIRVKMGGEISSPFTGTGATNQDFNIRFEIRLDVQSSVSGTISGTSYSGNELANLVSDQIIEVMETNATSVTGVKLITRESVGAYKYDDMHYYIHMYNAFMVND